MTTRSLAIAVLDRAIRDARGEVNDEKNRSRCVAWQEDARRWIREGPETYQAFCALADIDGEALRERVLG